MDIFMNVQCLAIPLLVFLNWKLKRRTKGIVTWVFMWAQAGLFALSSWRLYQSWLACLALTAKNPYYHPRFPYELWWSRIEIVVLLVLPVVWYRRDLKKNAITEWTDDQTVWPPKVKRPLPDD